MSFITDDDDFREPTKEFCCSVNVSGGILFTTPEMTSFLLYAREELERRPFAELVHPQDRPIVTAKLSNLSRGVEHIEFSARCITGDGSFTDLKWTINPCGGMYTAIATVSAE